MITRLRILFPKGFDTMGFLAFSTDAHGMPTCAVLWRNIWPQGAFTDGLYVQVGMLMQDETDIFGRARAVPALGLVQGVLVDRRPALWDSSAVTMASGQWEWLNLELTYNMNDHGPVIWQGDWHLIAQDTEGVPPWAYSVEQEDG